MMNANDYGGLTLAEGVRYRRLGQEGVTLKQRDAEILVLNEVGIRVLELVGERKRFDQIVAQLLEEYQVDRSMLESDVRRYFDELLACGVVVPEGE